MAKNQQNAGMFLLGTKTSVTVVVLFLDLIYDLVSLKFSVFARTEVEVTWQSQGV